MKGSKKLSSSERQELIIHSLKGANKPITGTEFARKANVSRQVIVQDVSLLKAKGEPIVATSQGYIYLNEKESENKEKMVIVCRHSPEQTPEELFLIVDHGVTLKDVIIEHPVYGDLTASLRISNRFEANQFLQKIKNTKASYLSNLTDGVHLHTIEADSIKKLESVCIDLERAGILIKK
ncbi:transcription repressor NadR [Oceanobacillus caeni]|uniref:transcription repressor NadR n=1 Tax=Oceanobacillus caeni TaxID=405946 RepID=UPI0006221EC2|nr:transcription repressor NadR [Oceanobacillus caeni]KKE80171.1 transcriptional regulator [Bacilli bacterium VT-13-104]PZD83444.1 transcription repressor NadR [Bacilli bacterium]MCR1835346.1 transcription repressor NadR [Oceanobacillus caeni]PZD84215.1 transcription repressor NadR [Bacilli bacterium]PZD87435.1 transcription repressor NadR [Bacilli bacterium]